MIKKAAGAAMGHVGAEALRQHKLQNPRDAVRGGRKTDKTRSKTRERGEPVPRSALGLALRL